MNWIPLAAGVGLCLFIYGAIQKKLFAQPPRRLFYAGLILCIPFLILWIIAGSDRLFLRTVHLEQRLISSNEEIRKKAQQDLLGLDVEAKQQVAWRLAPSVEQENDSAVRKWAAIALALIGPSARETIPALLQGVSAAQGDVAQACRVAIAEIGAPDPEQLPTLLQAIEDSREPVRCEAAGSIARMGPAAEEAVPVLIAHLKREEPVPACFSNALAQISVFLPSALNSVLSLLQADRSIVRVRSIQVLAQMSSLPPPAAQALLTRLGQDTDSEVRRLSAKVLRLPFPPDRGLVPTLLDATKHSKSDVVRQAALDQLKQTHVTHEEVLPALLDAMNDSNADVRLASLEWLTQLNSRTRSVTNGFLSRLKDDDVRIRRMALRALRGTLLRQPEAYAWVARKQRDPDPLVRCLAAEQLVEMGAADRVAVRLLIDDLRAGKDEAFCAAEALSQAGHFNSDVVYALIRVLGEKDRSLRSRAASILMQLGARAKEAIPALQQAQKDQIPGAEMALRAIRSALRGRSPVR